MNLLTKNTDYAIRALLELMTDSGKYLSAREISQRQKIPYQFLRGIMQELLKHGYISSKEGVNGGFKLSEDPKNIKINDIVKIFQGDLQLIDCMFRKKICHNRTTCVLRKELKRIEKIIYSEFDNISIYSLSK